MTQCQCTTPPGGGGQCNRSQLAVCRVEGGKCRTSCIDIAADLQRKLQIGLATTQEVLEWVADAIWKDLMNAGIGAGAHGRLRLADHRFRNALANGDYIDDQGATLARFALPAYPSLPGRLVGLVEA